MIPALRSRASSSILDSVAARVLRPSAGLTSHETLALLGLARLADDARGAPVIRTHGDLAARWACSVATVKRILAALALRGLIRIERRTGPGGGDAPSGYALNLDALGVVPRELPGGAAGPAPLVTRAGVGASDPDLRSGSPDRSERAQSPAAEPSPVESIPAVREAAQALAATMAASPDLTPLAVPAVVTRLAVAVVGAHKPVRVACRGLVELADAVALARAVGAPWSRDRLARGLRSWALAARGEAEPEGDYRARVAADLAASVASPTRGPIVRPRVDARAAAEVARACVSRVA